MGLISPEHGLSANMHLYTSSKTLSDLNHHTQRQRWDISGMWGNTWLKTKNKLRNKGTEIELKLFLPPPSRCTQPITVWSGCECRGFFFFFESYSTVQRADMAAWSRLTSSFSISLRPCAAPTYCYTWRTSTHNTCPTWSMNLVKCSSSCSIPVSFFSHYWLAFLCFFYTSGEVCDHLGSSLSTSTTPSTILEANCTYM